MADVVETCMLDASHRCDRCGAQAYVLVVLEWNPGMTGDELYFCRHDFNKAEEAIRPRASLIIDERDRLFEHVRDDGHYVEGKAAR